jgi:hypothetical protein
MRGTVNGNAQTTYAFYSWQLTYVRSLRKTGKKYMAESACTKGYSGLLSLHHASTNEQIRTVTEHTTAKGISLTV